MYYVNEKECERANLDIKKIASIARRLSKAAKEASDMGITVFGGSGTGSLRFRESEDKKALILAYIDGDVDGGDGACLEDEDGLLRGEC